MDSRNILLPFNEPPYLAISLGEKGTMLRGADYPELNDSPDDSRSLLPTRQQWVAFNLFCFVLYTLIRTPSRNIPVRLPSAKRRNPSPARPGPGRATGHRGGRLRAVAARLCERCGGVSRNRPPIEGKRCWDLPSSVSALFHGVRRIYASVIFRLFFPFPKRT